MSYWEASGSGKFQEDVTHLISPLGRICVCVIVISVLIARNPDALLKATFWAEDGAVFFLQSHLHGLPSIFIPYAGYHHLSLRLLSQCFTQFPLDWLPYVYSASSIALAGVLAAIWTGPRVPLTRAQKLIFAFSIPLIPHTGEVFYNIANLQWLLASALLYFLVVCPVSTTAKAVSVLIAFVLGLTGVYSILFLPLFALNYLQNRQKYYLALGLAVGVSACVQAITIARFSMSTPPEAWTDFSVLVLPWRLLWPLIPIAGSNDPEYTTAKGLLTAFALLLLAFLVVRRRNNMLPVYLFAAALILTSATLFRFRHSLSALAVPIDGDRYFWLPRLLIVWSIATILPFRTRISRSIALLAAVSAIVPGFSFRSQPHKEWRVYAKKIKRGEEVNVPINPDGSQFRVPALQGTKIPPVGSKTN